ncbi:RNA 2prime [Diplonema papillatum]|nr:RNA 2prime [Diplonema papillatum]
MRPARWSLRLFCQTAGSTDGADIHRLFVAFDLDETTTLRLQGVRNRLTTVLHGCTPESDWAVVKWVPAHQYHATVRFIGEVEATATDGIRAALSEVRQSSFEAQVLGAEVFPRPEKPRALAVSLDLHPSLAALSRDVADAVTQSVPYAPAPPRQYRPHVTLARFKGHGPAELTDALPLVNELLRDAPPVVVSSFQLYDSVLTPSGAVHTVIEKFSLL